jgi:hypothetical protein
MGTQKSSASVYGTRAQARQLWMFMLARQPSMMKYIGDKAAHPAAFAENASKIYRIGTLPAICEAWILVHCGGKSEFAWLLVQIKRKYRRMNQGNHVTIYSPTSEDVS